MTITIEVTNHFDFLDKICPQKGYFWSKAEHFYWILHIRISRSTKFWLKLTISNFWTKFVPKKYFRLKTEKMNLFIEFWIFKLAYVSSFILNWQLWFFWPNLSQKCISGRKQRKWTSPFNSVYSKQCRYQIAV